MQQNHLIGSKDLQGFL